jgi:predicted amidohydrolase YtcJ
MRTAGVIAKVVFTAAWLGVTVLAAQNVPSEVAKMGYADTVVVNGNIVSMDDQGYNANSGHKYQAMAIKKTRIMKLGTNEEVRALAGPKTKIIDVGQRLVIPGIIDTHAHLFGNAQVAASMGIKVPPDGVSLNLTAGKDMEATRLKVENAIKDAVTKLKPGDWVNVGLNGNPQENVSNSRVAAWLSQGDLEPRSRLSNVAPKNPVLLQSGSRGIMNSAAYDLMTKLIPEFADYEDQEVTDVSGAQKLGVVAVGGMTSAEWDVWYANQPTSMLAEMIRRDWEMAAAHGEVAFGSRVHHPRIMEALNYLNRQGVAPVRMMMLIEVHRKPNDPDFMRQLYKITGNLTGLGDDMMWMGGVASELWDSSFPQNCLGNDLPAPPEIKKREKCMKPGDMYWDALQTALENGWRLAGVHGVASDGVRRYLQLIEMAMKNSGQTVDDIRRLRMTTEHAEALGNVPDVIAKLKEFGVIVSANPPRMARIGDYIQDYGPKAEAFMQPIKSWLDQGVSVVGQFEGYRAIGADMNMYITRVVNGRTILPDQKLDRVTVLKLWTTWAPRYMMKEKDMGTLETGKLADFVVLDKDFFTIPTDDIPKITPLMTVMGGKVRAVQASFASTVGMEPVGWQFPAGYQPWAGASIVQ